MLLTCEFAYARPMDDMNKMDAAKMTTDRIERTMKVII